MKDQSLSPFFHSISKAVIIFPVVVILIALFFKAYDTVTFHYKNASLAPTPIVSISPTVAPATMKLDLKGPYVCVQQKNDQNVALYIKNQQVSAQFTQNGKKESVLLKGDCLYKWEGYQGEKTCGISQFLGIFQALSSLGGGMDANGIIGMISKTGLTSATDEAMMQEVAQACKKEAVVDSVFNLPTNVTFKAGALLKNLPSPSK